MNHRHSSKGIIRPYHGRHHVYCMWNTLVDLNLSGGRIYAILNEGLLELHRTKNLARISRLSKILPAIKTILFIAYI